MVVIASMVGAPGLGEEVYRAVTQLKTGVGFETGLSIVIVAIILDRITQHAGKKKQGGTYTMKLTKKVLGLGAVALLAVGLAACGNDDGNNETSTETDTSKSVGESVDYKITGIDPGAGIMEATERAIEEYELTDWDWCQVQVRQ